MSAPSLTLKAWPGNRTYLGATVEDGGVNFAVASTVAEQVTLCLFDDQGNETRRARGTASCLTSSPDRPTATG
jgi:pullulanase/glycogen debranching enzyme